MKTCGGGRRSVQELEQPFRVGRFLGNARLQSDVVNSVYSQGNASCCHSVHAKIAVLPYQQGATQAVAHLSTLKLQCHGRRRVLRTISQTGPTLKNCGKRGSGGCRSLYELD